MAADWTANYAIQLLIECHYLSNPPPNLIDILQADAKGVNLSSHGPLKLY